MDDNALSAAGLTMARTSLAGAPVLLVVDDVPTNLDVMREVLAPHFRLKLATSGEIALAVAAGAPQPDLILLDVMMEGIDGLETCRRLKANPITAGIPVIFVTALSEEIDEERGFAIGAVDYITKPVRPAVVLARVRTHLMVHNQNLALELKVRQRTEELSQTRLEIIRRLGRAAEFRDNETGLHVLRMSNYARLIAEAYCGRPAWAEVLFHAAPMHDVGKIGIPDHILLKPTSLTEDEWRIMRTHPQLGAGIIGNDDFELMSMSREVALGHHEKWDGSGYPRGLAREDIPLSARIAAIADVFDALTTERPYKTAWGLDAALDYLSAQGGRHFDPRALECFYARLADILAIKDQYAESTRESGPG